MKVRNPKIVRSRLRVVPAFFFGLVLLFVAAGSTLFLVRILAHFEWREWWAILLGAFFLSLSLYVLNLVVLRLEVIDRERGCVTCRSLFRPRGRTYFFRDFTDKYLTSDSIYTLPSNKIGIHLVDGGYVRRIAYCPLYHNWTELYDAIPLPESRKYLTLWEELILGVAGRVGVPKRWNK
jgi:hypothetical protein